IKPDAAKPGFRNIILEPNFVEGLDHFEASFNGRYGLIRSAWKKDRSRIDYTVEIPANSQALLHLPANRILSIGRDQMSNWQTPAPFQQKEGKKSYQLEAGKYLISIK
ncbi:MAG: alpha-rhamnosidase, partial [Pedobacter sp.]